MVFETFHQGHTKSNLYGDSLGIGDGDRSDQRSRRGDPLSRSPGAEAARPGRLVARLLLNHPPADHSEGSMTR